MQRPSVLRHSDITLGINTGEILLEYSGHHGQVINYSNSPMIQIKMINGKPTSRLIKNSHGSYIKLGNVVETEPKNLIYPYLSNRKVVKFDDKINQSNSNSVLGNFTNLYSKIDRLVTPQFQPGNEQYLRACNDILGFEISTLASVSGKKAVYFVDNMEHIPLTAMGEGVTNIVGLIADLCVAKDKIFLIEEPENDIHPKALKALLKLISEKASTNQFFISTHSNIVMKNLGAVNGAKIFNVSSTLSDSNREKLFVSTLSEVPKNSEERRRVLEDLGYEFYDYGLWTGWLFLEESSAEVLIRDWFIKWYVPSLQSKLRTYSANTISQIIPKFEDFNKLFVFLHLEPTYKNKVWVIIDSGEDEREIIDKLKSMYVKNGWNEDNFSQFSEHDFEKYYPDRFQKEVNSVLSLESKKDKRRLKRELLNKVKDWIKKNEEIAKDEFGKSAKPVIDKLKMIKKHI